MNNYEKGMKILEEKFGGGRDNVIALATIALEPAEDGRPQPIVRDVDAYYEDGIFYVVTWARSAKMLQIAANSEVGIAVCFEWFNAEGSGENLGWVLNPKNADLRVKLRRTFAAWYDMANNENDENCCILAIRLKKGIININHFETRYHMDFENKTAVMEGQKI